MTPPLLDSRPVAESVMAAVTAELGGTTAYDLATVPGGNHNDGFLPTMYAVVRVERRLSESALRVGAPQGTTGWRVTVGCVGQSVREASWVMARASAALEDVWLTVTTPTGPTDILCRFDAADAPEYDTDADRFAGSVAFTCAT